MASGGMTPMGMLRCATINDALIIGRAPYISAASNPATRAGGLSAIRKFFEPPLGRQSLNWRYISISVIDLWEVEFTPLRRRVSRPFFRRER